MQSSLNRTSPILGPAVELHKLLNQVLALVREPKTAIFQNHEFQLTELFETLVEQSGRYVIALLAKSAECNTTSTEFP